MKKIKNPQAKLKSLLHITDRSLYYYEVHVLDDEDTEKGRSYFFECNKKLETQQSIIKKAQQLKIIDSEDADFTDYAHPITESEYKEAQG